MLGCSGVRVLGCSGSGSHLICKGYQLSPPPRPPAPVPSSFLLVRSMASGPTFDGPPTGPRPDPAVDVAGFFQHRDAVVKEKFVRIETSKVSQWCVVCCSGL